MVDAPELKTMYDSEEHIRRLIDAAKSIEGVARHASTHAAGVVVSGEPLTEIVPIQRATKGEELAMTQYPHEDAGEGRPAEDGLPGAEQPHHRRQHPPAGGPNRGRRRSTSPRSRWTTRQPSRC